jgi:RimJ/RimL family protein N-acetyltransferase
MDHDITLSAFGLRLRPVRVKDAPFILQLRCDPRLNRYINETPNDLKLQKKWLREYLQREGDYYFCAEIEKTGKPVGLVAIYEIPQDKSTAEWGRWVMAPGVLAAPACVYLMAKIGLEILHLPEVYSRTVEKNTRVVSFHDSMGAERFGTTQNSVVIRGVSYNHVLHRITQNNWKTIEPRLTKTAGQAAKFLDAE